jgi:hypothetical protein
MKGQELVVGLIFTAAVWTLLTAFSKGEVEKGRTKCAKCNCRTGAEKCNPG